MGKYRITKFKRAYIEITSVCNLSCSFCQETRRPAAFMSIENFRHVISEIKPFTGFIYLHVKGEPLLHPDLAAMLDLCEANDIKASITTNGTLLKKCLPTLIEHPVHQINISLHSADDNACIDSDAYYREVLDACEEINAKTPTEISLRFWNVEDADTLLSKRNFDLRPRLHLNVQSPFEWADVDNDYYCERGFCQGLRTHFAVLCDGTVVPCCLDGNGVMALGNIFDVPLSEILSTPRATAIFEGFNRRVAVEELCKHCNYKERFNQKWQPKK
jgi:radical SAM protein with 4Fe4S-binding SPASM domain